MECIVPLVVAEQLPGSPTSGASLPTPPPPPTSPTSNDNDDDSGDSPISSNDGGSSGVSHPIAQKPWVPQLIPVRNSTGVNIGYVTANSPNDISLDVQGVGFINGQPVNVTVHAMLNSVPADPKMDINFVMPDVSQFLDAFPVRDMLAGVELSGFSNGLSIMGSTTLTLSVPGAVIGNNDISKALVLHYDGQMSEMLCDVKVSSGMDVNGNGPDSNGMIIVTITSPHDTFANGGRSLYAWASTAVLLTPTPTPVPTSLPVMPTPNNGTGPHNILFMSVVTALVAVDVATYFVFVRKK